VREPFSLFPTQQRLLCKCPMLVAALRRRFLVGAVAFGQNLPGPGHSFRFSIRVDPLSVTAVLTITRSPRLHSPALRQLIASRFPSRCLPVSIVLALGLVFRHFVTGPLTLQVGKFSNCIFTLQPGRIADQFTVSAQFSSARNLNRHRSASHRAAKYRESPAERSDPLASSHSARE